MNAYTHHINPPPFMPSPVSILRSLRGACLATKSALESISKRRISTLFVGIVGAWSDRPVTGGALCAAALSLPRALGEILASRSLRHALCLSSRSQTRPSRQDRVSPNRSESQSSSALSQRASRTQKRASSSLDRIGQSYRARRQGERVQNWSMSTRRKEEKAMHT